MSANRSQNRSESATGSSPNRPISSLSNGLSNGSVNQARHASSAAQESQRRSAKPSLSNPGQSVLKMLSEEKGVGVDLKSSAISRTGEASRTNASSGSAPAQSLGFLRPAGVDSPKDSSAAKISKRSHDETKKDSRTDAGSGEPSETARKKKRKSNE